MGLEPPYMVETSFGPETHRGDVMEVSVLEAKVEDYKAYDEDYNEDSSSTAYGFWLMFSCMVICSVIGILTTCRRFVIFVWRRAKAAMPRIVYPQASPQNRGDVAIATRRSR